MPGSDRKPSGNVDVAVRERLLQAAVDAFARFGFAGSSLRDIAQQAGVAFQLITYYFGSKDDLWLAAVDHLYGESEKVGPAAFDPEGDFEAQLRDWVRNAIEGSIRQPQLVQILCQEYLAGSPRYELYLKPKSRATAPHFSQLFDEAHRRNLGLHFSTQEMLLILHSLQVMASLAPEAIAPVAGGRLDSPGSIDLLVDFIVNVLLRGRGAQGATPGGKAS